MKIRHWFCIFFTLLASVLSASAQDPLAGHAAKIFCEEPVYDFGERDNSTEVDHAFVLRNDGDLTLEIGQVRPACGCTVANLSEKSIAPGNSATLTTRLNLRGRNGPQNKTITVESNDPRQPQLILTLKGSAVAELTVSPAQVFFGRLNPDSAVTNAVEVSIRGEEYMTILESRVDAPFYAVTHEAKEEGKSYLVKVSTIPPLPDGQARGSVYIKTSHPRHAEFSIPVAAFVVKAAPQ